MNEKVNGLEGKLGKEMFGMAMIARSKAKAAALEVMKDYKVSAVGGTARKSGVSDVPAFHWISPPSRFLTGAARPTPRRSPRRSRRCRHRRRQRRPLRS